MDPVLQEIYSTVLPAAPYVIIAYALIFLILFIYVIVIVHGMRNTDKQLQALEAALAEKQAKSEKA
jgi:hypothetical protein